MRGPQRVPSRTRPSSRSTSSSSSSSSRGPSSVSSSATAFRNARLVGDAPGLGLADRRQPPRADQLGRAADRRLAVAEVRAEADVGDRHRRRSAVTAANSTSMPGGPHVRLADAHPHPLGLEALDERVGERRRERLEQPARLGRHLAHRRRDLAVVDRVLDPVVGAALAHLELDVVEEPLALLALVLVDAVVAVELEPAQLDLHGPRSTARAARAAPRRAARTSCTRRIVAPRS